MKIRTGFEATGSAEALVSRAARAGRLAPLSEVEAVLAACRASGVAAIALDGAAYPPVLHHLPDPPPVLYAQGDLGALAGSTVVIVGSRRATAYGRRVAGALAVEAVRAGWVVVSGMALGIDGAAHRGALEAGGVSAAVLGSGVDRPTPRAHAGLAARIVERGCVLSELPPGVPARPHHFPRRNRLLAALGTHVVVVEAAQRSGALITARMALDLGRDVWAVPSPIFSPVCEGTHALLEDGARPVASLRTWREALRPDAPGVRARSPGPGSLPDWGEDARAVWGALGEGRTLEDLLSDSTLGSIDVLPALTLLELGGWVVRGANGEFRRGGS